MLNTKTNITLLHYVKVVLVFRVKFRPLPLTLTLPLTPSLSLTLALILALTLTPTYRLCEPLVLDVPVDEEHLEGLSLGH